MNKRCLISSIMVSMCSFQIPQTRITSQGSYRFHNQLEMNHNEDDSPIGSPKISPESDLMAQLQYITKELKASKQAKEEQALLQAEWDTVSATLDHLAFFVFAIVVVISVVFVFWPALF